jgi:hypothetical protein
MTGSLPTDCSSHACGLMLVAELTATAPAAFSSLEDAMQAIRALPLVSSASTRGSADGPRNQRRVRANLWAAFVAVSVEQRRDYFTVLAAMAPAPPDAEQRRMQRVGTRLGVARALLHARLPVPESSGCIFSEADSEAGTEEPL